MRRVEERSHGHLFFMHAPSARSLPFLSALPIVMALASCADIPMSSDGLRAQQQTTTTVCSQRSVDETAATLEKAWSKCYVGAGLREVAVMAGHTPIFVPVNGAGESLRVDVEHTTQRDVVAVRMPDGRVPLIADIHATSSCPAEVVARGVQLLWISSAENTKSWLDNPDAAGPAMACK